MSCCKQQKQFRLAVSRHMATTSFKCDMLHENTCCLGNEEINRFNKNSSNKKEKCLSIR